MILCLCRLLAAESILFSICLCVCVCVSIHLFLLVWSCTTSLWPRYLTNCLWEFTKLHCRCSWVQRRLFRFQGQKIKGQGHSETKCGQLIKALFEFEGHGFKAHTHRQSFQWRHTSTNCRMVVRYLLSYVIVIWHGVSKWPDSRLLLGRSYSSKNKASTLLVLAMKKKPGQPFACLQPAFFHDFRSVHTTVMVVPQVVLYYIGSQEPIFVEPSEHVLFKLLSFCVGD